MGEIVILNQHGDIKVEWDPADADSVANAKKEFARLKADGYNFYEVAEARGKPVTRFDKTLGKVLAAPGAARTRDKEKGTRPRAMRGGPVTQRQSSRR